MSHEAGDDVESACLIQAAPKYQRVASLGQSIYLRYPVRIGRSRLGTGATADKLTGTVNLVEKPFAVASGGWRPSPEYRGRGSYEN